MKTINILLFCLFSYGVSIAQINKVWDKSIAAADIQNPVLVNKNSDNTIDIIGKIRNQGNDVTLSYGQHDYWFCKLNANGVKKYDYTYGGSGVDFCKSAVKAVDGGYVIIGVSTSSDGIKNTAIPPYNYNSLWVVKIDTAGQMQWQKQFVFNTLSNFMGSVDYYKGPVICNTSSGYAIICNSYMKNNNSTDILFSTDFIGLDFFGNKTGGGIIGLPEFPQNNTGYTSNNLFINYVYQLANGNLMALGYGNANGLITNKKGVCVELKPNGQEVNHNIYSSSGTCDLISGKELSPNGQRLFFASSIHDNTTGYSRTVNSKAASTKMDIWTFKTNNVGGSITDQVAIGCAADVQVGDLVQQSSRNVFYANNLSYLMLTADGVGFDKTENPKGSTDYWVVEYDYINNLVKKEKTFGGTLAERGQSIYADKDNLYLLGTSQSPISGDKTTSIKSAGPDMWLVKACLPPDAPKILNSLATFGTNFVIGCVGQTATISISAPQNGFTYSWYDSPSGGSLVGVGTQINPFIASSFVSFYVEAQNGFCKSSRTQVTVSPQKTPSIPVIVGPTVLCLGDTLKMYAKRDTLNTAYAKYISHWYNASGKLVSVLDTLILIGIARDTSFSLTTIDSLFPSQVSQFNLTKFNCESQSASINISVQHANKPVVTFTDPNCIYSQVTFTVTNMGGNSVQWIDKKGNVLKNGNPLIYINKNNIDTIYAKLITSGGCSSVLKEIISTVQNSKPSVPSIVNSYAVLSTETIPTCEGTTATVNIKNPINGVTYNWFDASVAGTLLNSGNAYSIGNIMSGGVYEYWIEANNGYCISDRKNIKIYPIRTPKAPTITGPLKICKYGNVLLVAKKDTSKQLGGSYKNVWYNSNNQIIGNGDSLNIFNVATSLTISCSTIDSIPQGYFGNLGPFLCEGAKTIKQIMIDSVESPKIQLSPITCVGSNVNLTITNANNNIIKWYNNSGTLLFTGSTYAIYNIQKNDTVLVQSIGINGCLSPKIKILINVSKPIAGFSCLKTNLNPGDIVQFSNQTVGGQSFQWDFDDGSTSSQINPWHYFYNPGYYSIKLITIGSNGCTDTLKKINYINVGNYIGINESSNDDAVIVYPNPFDGLLNIKIKGHEEFQLNIFDLLGEELVRRKIYQSEIIDLTKLASGVYFMSLTGESFTKTIKIIRK